MENSLFRGSHLKIKRANKHIHDLNDAINAFRESHPYRSWTEDDTETDSTLVKFEMTEEVTDKIALILGDAIHNLRAAVDIALCDLAKGLKETLGEFGGLTFRRTKDKVIAAMEDRQKQGFSKDFIFLIVDIVEPYKEDRGKDSIYPLHTLDIADKHQRLLPTFGYTLTIISTTQGGAPMGYLLVSTGRGDVDSVRLPKGAKLENYGNPTPDVLFDDVEGFRRKPIVPELHQLSQLVAHTVQKLEDQFLRNREKVRP